MLTWFTAFWIADKNQPQGECTAATQELGPFVSSSACFVQRSHAPWGFCLFPVQFLLLKYAEKYGLRPLVALFRGACFVILNVCLNNTTIKGIQPKAAILPKTNIFRGRRPFQVLLKSGNVIFLNSLFAICANSTPKKAPAAAWGRFQFLVRVSGPGQRRPPFLRGGR